jgi:hypothetical protein
MKIQKANEAPAARGVRVIREIASAPLTDGSAGSSAVGGLPARQINPRERHARIAEIAYRNAEKRGLTPGAELEDWLQAEREIDSEEPAPGVL